MEKKTDKPILTLALPFVVLDSNCVYDYNSYDDSGVYFVKDVDGLFHIVDVRLEDKRAFGNCVNASICNALTEQVAEHVIKDTLLPFCENILGQTTASCAKTDGIVNELVGLQGILRESVGLLDCLCSKIEDFERVLPRIENIASESLEINRAPKYEDMKGYVSEESLVEIIKNVRK